jgi:hypothetical protein
MLYWVNVIYGLEDLKNSRLATEQIKNLGIVEADTQWESMEKTGTYFNNFFPSGKDKRVKIFNLASKSITPGPVLGTEVDFVLFASTEGQSSYPDFTLKLNSPIKEVIECALCTRPKREDGGCDVCCGEFDHALRVKILNQIKEAMITC